MFDIEPLKIICNDPQKNQLQYSDTYNSPCNLSFDSISADEISSSEISHQSKRRKCLDLDKSFPSDIDSRFEYKFRDISRDYENDRKTKQINSIISINSLLN
ncbi:hypothetical protein AYI69_g9099 [Smittium culicis]|uniref:Uncharacterized protein n=1 Tax=Smittium culicis TaxID=133412 RepID=A0A1R1XF12_9FUNG|nr:hypothetical protein AYI69_g9099 [Smittium culicis]